RTFTTTPKGLVNAGDVVRKTGVNILMSSGSHVPQEAPAHGGIIVLQGDEGVGKTSLCRQFSSSEYMGTYNSLAGEPTSLTMICTTPPPPLVCTQAYQLDDVNVDAYLVVFSIVDLASFRVARDLARQLRVNLGTDRVIVLVGNKSDLVRKRQIKLDEARQVAATYDCKYLETSAALNHHVDHLVVGTLTQIRLQLLPPATDVLLAPPPPRPRARTPSPVSFFNRLFRRNVKSSVSCEGIFMK
ncbi:hypothetical protein EGW08_007686, partial [Elysia chlorotica]